LDEELLKARKSSDRVVGIRASLCRAGISTLRKVDQKYPENFEMWCWRRMYKISWTDGVKNKEVLKSVKKETKIPLTVKPVYVGHLWSHSKPPNLYRWPTYRNSDPKYFCVHMLHIH
jgi:hypothetical protein